MTKKPLAAVFSIALGLCSTTALAQSFNTFNPVTMAMGGVGVALPNPTTGTLYNPAELSATPREDRNGFAMGVSAGAEAYDPGKAINKVSDIRSNFRDLKNLVDGLSSSSSKATYDAIANKVAQINADLTDINQKDVTAEGGAGLLIDKPGRGLGIGVTASAVATVGAKTEYTDQQYLDQIETAARNQDYNGVKQYNQSSLTSDVRAVGVAIGEVGLNLSHQFAIAGHSLDIGVTPKFMKVMTINYSASPAAANTSDVRDSKYRKDYTDMNVDLGVLKDFGNGFYTGLVVRDLVPHTYKTAPDRRGRVETIKLRPQARVGVGYDRGWYRLGVDADLTKNQPVAFEQATRFIGVGGSLNAWGWAQLRAGYRFDTVNSSRDVVTAGIGISPFNALHFDIGAEANHHDVGSAAQVALTF